MLKNQQFYFSFKNLQLLRLQLHSNLDVNSGWLIFQKRKKKVAHTGQIEIQSSMLLFRFQSFLDTQSKPLPKSQHNNICIVFGSNPHLIPSSYPRFQPSSKRWILLKFRSESQCQKTKCGFLLPQQVSCYLCLLRFQTLFPLITKKMSVKIFHFLHANRIM